MQTNKILSGKCLKIKFSKFQMNVWLYFSVIVVVVHLNFISIILFGQLYTMEFSNIFFMNYIYLIFVKVELLFFFALLFILHSFRSMVNERNVVSFFFKLMCKFSLIYNCKSLK